LTFSGCCARLLICSLPGSLVRRSLFPSLLTGPPPRKDTMPTSQSLVVTDVNHDARTVTFADDHDFSLIRENLIPVTEYYQATWDSGVLFEPTLRTGYTTLVNAPAALDYNTIQRAVDRAANMGIAAQYERLINEIQHEMNVMGQATIKVVGTFKPKNYHGEMEGDNI